MSSSSSRRDDWPKPEGGGRPGGDASFRPAFAIGGIHAENVAQVIDAGMNRVAVSGAIIRANDPAIATRDILAQLQLE